MSVLFCSRREGLTLADALAAATIEGACALLSTPNRFLVAVVRGGSCQTATGVPVELATVFEARCFGPAAELRWLQDGPGTGGQPTGIAVLLADDQAVAARLGDPDRLTFDGEIPGAYLLWGEALVVGPGWTALRDARVGTIEVPIEAAGGRVVIETVEYIGVDGEGNAAVVEERLLALAVAAKEGR